MADPRTQILADLTAAVANAQAPIEQLKAPALTPEGWSAVRVNGTPPTSEMQDRFSPRHGCEWNLKERRDLVGKWLMFASVETLARTHRRTEGGIRSELQRLLGAQAGRVERALAMVAQRAPQPADAAQQPD